MRSAFRASSGETSGIATPEQWAVDFFKGGEGTSSGVQVSEDTALHYGPFFAGVNVISGDLASLPLITYERLERGKRRATDHPLYPLLHDAANDVMSAMAFRQTLMGHVLTWGNGYAEVVRQGGKVTALWPLRPDRVKPRVKRDGPGRVRLVYEYIDPVHGIKDTLLPDEVLHIAGLGGDGIRGWSVVRLAREAIGLGIATEKFGGTWFGNGSRPGGFVKHPGTLGDSAYNRLKASFENRHRGLDNANRVAILEEGMEWQQVGIPPEDAQFLETRRFGVTEMARWLRLPPHKIADLERATFSNIESQQLDYVTSALRVWFVAWEQAISLRLLGQQERGRFFAEHLADALLRGDLKTRYEAYAIGRNWGWLSADDVAEMENRNPLPDGRGEVYMVPFNMMPAPTPQQADALNDDEGRARALRQLVAGRGVDGRLKIAQHFKALIVDADTRLVKLESDKVTKLVKAHLDERALRAGRSAETFMTAVEELYRGQIAQATEERWTPIFATFSQEIAADAAADVAYEDEVDLSRWITAYVASHAAYRVASAVGQIAAQLVDAATPQDAAARVLARLAKWVAERPERTARWEGNQIPNATAREVWRMAGVRRLTWMAHGSEECQFCQELDGQTVSIDEPFVAAGSEVGPDGTLTVPRNTFHPPLHPACDCQVVPA
ncbi:phage portal protein [Streptomyces sp.]|uniref:phage portal protein n=1 Tax=Streptomyces sp. TaxID=1931 RepID=UPI002F9468C3